MVDGLGFRVGKMGWMFVSTTKNRDSEHMVLQERDISYLSKSRTLICEVSALSSLAVRWVGLHKRFPNWPRRADESITLSFLSKCL